MTGNPPGMRNGLSGANGSPRPLVSAIVVNHDRERLLMECLQSLLEQDYPELEVIVVDNASSDGSREAVRSIADPRLRLIALEQNRGFAGGNNAGFREARGEFLALLNNDATARPDWLSRMVAAARSDPAVGMCACKILFHGSRRIDKAGHLIFPDGQNRGRGTGEKDRGQYERLEEALFPDGCAGLYRRELIEETGGFDEDFFAYADDADLGLRARWKGWKCLYVPGAVALHRHSSTTGRFSRRKVYWVERNRLWLAVKNLPWPLLALSPLFTLYRWAWNLAAALRGRGAAGSFAGEESAWRLAGTILEASWDGVRGAGRMFAKRRALMGERKASNASVIRLFMRFRISARRLAFRDHPNRRG